MSYESLQREAEQQGIHIYEKKLPPRMKGLYSDKIIYINRYISTRSEKTCILAEEMGHYHTTVGDILDQSILSNRKQELRARRWAYEKLVPLTAFIEAHLQGLRSRHELAEHLDVTEEFLQMAINRYRDKYGIFVELEHYAIYFEPLGVLEKFE